MKRIEIIGHLGADATSQHWSNEDYTTFTVAVSEEYTDQNGVRQSKTDWIGVVNKGTKILPYLTKGKQVFVEGSPSIRQHTNKNGDPQANIQIRARTIQLLGKAESPANTINTDKTDDLPF